jgi:hypothetical protein
MRYLLVIFLLISFFLLPPQVYSSGFYLKKIGALEVEGINYNHLWYTNPSLTFVGSGVAGATVTADFNDSSQNVIVDSEGNWSLPAVLNEGDNSISFSSNGSVISFTLTIGENIDGIGGLPQAATPVAGTTLPTILFLAIGGTLILAGFVWKRHFVSA